jgi:hypothetical protein
MIIRRIIAAVFAAGCAVPMLAGAVDTYTCFAPPGPGGLANGILAHGKTDSAGNAIEVGDFGGSGFVYTTGAGWTSLAPQQVLTPADPYVGAAAAGPTTGFPYLVGINAAGTVVGSFSVYPWPAAPATGTYWGLDLPLIWNSVTGYANPQPQPWVLAADQTFFAPPNQGFLTYYMTDFLGIGDNGLIGGEAYDPTIATDTAGIGFIYNPTAGTIDGFAPGYTTVQPALSDGSKPQPGSGFSIVWDFNHAGWFVGGGLSATQQREAIVYNPTGSQYYYLTSPNAVIMARGINDGDTASPSGNCPTAGPCYRIAGWSAPWDSTVPTYGSSGGQVGYYADFDPVSGAFQQPQVVHCDQQTGTAALPGIASWVFTGIDNKNVLYGQWKDSLNKNHPLLAIPNGSLGLPVSTANGVFTFDVVVPSDSSTFYIDPPVALGYRYKIGEGNPRFGSVTLPILSFGTSYTIEVDDRRFEVAPGQVFDFTRVGHKHGVRSFRVKGIDPANALNPANPTAFITGLTLVSAGKFTGTMRPLTDHDHDNDRDDDD